MAITMSPHYLCYFAKPLNSLLIELQGDVYENYYWFYVG
jgi:hypothetical protein